MSTLSVYFQVFHTFAKTNPTCTWHGHTVHPITRNLAFGSLKSTKWAWRNRIYCFFKENMYTFSVYLHVCPIFPNQANLPMALPHNTPHYKECGFWFTKIHQVGMELWNLQVFTPWNAPIFNPFGRISQHV
jgi:hypothetical protein